MRLDELKSASPASDPVSFSSASMRNTASSKLDPQKAGSGWKEAQTRGLSDFPHRAQRFSGVRCGHRVPAGLFRVDMERAMQHAPHLRHSNILSFLG